MISEPELARLSYPEMPKIVTNDLPGPKARRLIDEALKLQTPTRPSVFGTLVIEEGLGAGIKDPDGNIFIDMSAGVAVSSVGRNHPRVVEAVRAQSGKLMHSAGLVTETTVALARKVSEVMPEGLRGECFTWFGMSGSAAVETAIKYAKAITGRSQIVAFEGAYHGVFHGSLALTTREGFRKPFRPLMPDAIHLPYGYCYRCFADLKYPSCGIACGKYFDYKLTTPNTGAEDVAAVIVEPMQADGGYIDPPVEFMRALRETCTKKQILLIADEVQAGAGRSGKMWSIEHYGIVPDMLTWAKAVGGDMPLSGLTIHNRYYSKLPQASQVITSAENALANVVALANLEIMTDPTNNLLERCAVVGEEIKQHFINASKSSRIIDEVRGRGLFIGIELVSDKKTRKPLSPKIMGLILKKCEQRGARIMGCGRFGSTVRLMPPLIITRDHLRKGCDILIEAIRESEADVAA
jgi:4-aminobutyrate aminotransferase